MISATNPAYPEMNEHGIFFHPCAIMINHVQSSPLECVNSREDKKLLDTPLPSIEQAFSNLKDQVSHGIACGTKDMKIVAKLVYHRGDVNKTVELFQITLLFFESNVELWFLNIFGALKEDFKCWLFLKAMPDCRHEFVKRGLAASCDWPAALRRRCLVIASDFSGDFSPQLLGFPWISISWTDLWPWKT